MERADTGVLLAMKPRACRPRKDLFDLAVLLRHHDVRSVVEAEAWLDRFFPEDQVKDPSIVEAALGAITLPTDPPHQPGAGHYPGDRGPPLPAVGYTRRRTLCSAARSPPRPLHYRSGVGLSSQLVTLSTVRLQSVPYEQSRPTTKAATM